jgi:cytochrome c peroxidase
MYLNRMSREVFALLFLFFSAVFSHGAVVFLEGGTANVGARFFLETRFSKFFYENSGGNVNFVLTNGDPVMDTTVTVNGTLPGPFAGRAMNCRACHMVQEQFDTENRTYADFAPRSPIPANGDGRTHTPRNSIDLVNSLALHSTPLFLHNDGEFVNMQDLIIGTFAGRNFGWKPSEYSNALAHIVRVIREDDGQGILAQQYGGYTYREAFAGGPDVADIYRIAAGFILSDVSVTNTAATNYVSDERIIQDMAALIEAYLGTLFFSRDEDLIYNGSAFDLFLIKNALPRKPAANESPVDYGRRLLRQVSNLLDPRFVTDPADGHLTTHRQSYRFGPTELEGLKIFLAEDDPPSSRAIPGRTGNCLACHAPPEFTDFLFHNTGAAQVEYDAIHGSGAFMNVIVPELSVRNANYDAFLQPTPYHPNAAGRFITPPTLDAPGNVDLGLWNVFANPDFPKPQPALQQILPLMLPEPTLQFLNMSKQGNNFTLVGAKGTPGRSFYVLTTTNLLLPLTDWTIVATNTFGSDGNFVITDPMLPGPQRFYKVAAAIPSLAEALPHMIARFKTPDLRDLISSDPYFHTGRINTLPDAIAFYQNVSALARAGALRNADPKLQGISLDGSAVAPLVAFLRSLSEDYVDIPCPCD